MDFKFFRGKPDFGILTLLQQPSLTLQQPRRDNVEFCFQFDDNEPVHFGSGESDLHIIITPTTNGNITFNDNGRVFKIFSREINEGGTRA